MKRAAVLLLLITATAFVGYRLFEKHEEAKESALPNSNKTTGTKSEAATEAKPDSTPTIFYASSSAEKLDPAFAKFQTGDYAETVKLLRQKRIENPDDPTLKQNLATALFALGLQRLKEMRMAEAENLFEEAADLGHPGSTTALAALRVKSGNIETALAALERVYDSRKDPEAMRALIDLALSRDDLIKTEYYLNRAESDLIEKNPNPEPDEAIANFIRERRNRLKLRRLFNDDAITLDLGRAQVAFLQEEKRTTAQVVLETLSDSVEDLSRKFFLPPEEQRFRAIVLSRESFRGNTGAPPWAQAIFDGILRIPVPPGPVTNGELTQAKSVTRHETLHAYLYYLCGDLFPSWLGEGLAQIYDGRQLSQSIAALRIKLGRKLPKETEADPWFNRPFMEAPSTAIDELYARSFLLVSVIQRQKGAAVWKHLVAKVCVEKEPLAAVSLDLFGASDGLSIWREHHQALSDLFLARQ